MIMNWIRKIIVLCFLACTSEIIYAQVDTNMSIKNALPFAEKLAEYPGGQNQLMQYLNTSLRYPNQAVEEEITGKVEIEFVVCEDGTVCDIRVLRSPHSLLSNEAIRVIKTMQKWKPAEQNGKVVSCYYKLPIQFSLESPKSKRKE
jgi:TonB family protein